MAEEIQETNETVEDVLDFTEIVKYEKNIKGYGVFKLTLPTPLQKIRIIRKVTEELGEAAKIMDAIDYNYAKGIYELNEIITLPENFPWVNLLECRDDDLLVKLFVWYKNDCEKEYQSAVKKKKLK